MNNSLLVTRAWGELFNEYQKHIIVDTNSTRDFGDFVTALKGTGLIPNLGDISHDTKDVGVNLVDFVKAVEKEQNINWVSNRDCEFKIICAVGSLS